MAKQSSNKGEKTPAKTKAPAKTAEKTPAKAAAVAPVKAAAKPAPAKESKPAGAHATGPGDFIITRKWSGKTVEGHVGAHVHVKLPESTLRGMAWQLLKLPHGVELAGANVEQLSKPEGLTNQNRVFDFNLAEAGDYTLQFTLQRGIGQHVADTFKVKVQARD